MSRTAHFSCNTKTTDLPARPTASAGIFRVLPSEQFDTSQRELLTDLLALYEFVPGALFYAGYRSLSKRPSVQAGMPNLFGNSNASPLFGSSRPFGSTPMFFQHAS